MGCASSKYRASVVVINDKLRQGSDDDELQSAQYPDYWLHQDPSQGPFHEIVECGEDEIKAVQAILDGTLVDYSGEPVPVCNVKRLLRLEDSAMWLKYERSMDCLSEHRFAEQDEGPSVVRSPWTGSIQQVPLTSRHLPREVRLRMRFDCNEAYLWHGSERKALEGIMGNHFDIKRAGKAHAKALGRGAYFAEAASLSDKYAPVGPDGLHGLLLVRCALGRVYVAKRYTTWRSGKLKRMVSTTKLVHQGEYDSVLGDRKFAFNMDVREYVVANNAQLYPEYMVLYSRRMPDKMTPPK